MTSASYIGYVCFGLSDDGVKIKNEYQYIFLSVHFLVSLAVTISWKKPGEGLSSIVARMWYLRRFLPLMLS
jgi:hypothetical protein